MALKVLRNIGFMGKLLLTVLYKPCMVKLGAQTSKLYTYKEVPMKKVFLWQPETQNQRELLQTLLYNHCKFGENWVSDIQVIHPQSESPQETAI